MKLSDLISSADTLAGLQGIEQRLQVRRYRSRWSLAVAALSCVAQVALLLAKGLKPRSLLDLISWNGVLFWVALAAALVWVVARYTGFLFNQSREPFRYTFCIDKFSPVEATPGERFAVARVDQLQLLRYDLTERLNRRVRRLSLLKSIDAADASHRPEGVNFVSHFDIAGDYAIREDRNTDEWVIHVWPRIRIGPATNPFRLSFPVRLPLEAPEGKGNDVPNPGLGPQPGRPLPSRTTLGAEDYDRLVERVYSSIATEIYRQIQTDLQDKMALFPTESLRALARYNEAEDFETSNTIDAYDRALELYKQSLVDLKTSRWHRFKSRLAQWSWLLTWEPIGLKAALQTEAKTHLGYARCLIYRRLASEMAGRTRNPIFEVRKQLNDARRLLRRCYDSAIPKQLRSSSGSESFRHLLTFLRFPVPTAWRRRRQQLYEEFREELCRAYAVSALGHKLLIDSSKAKDFLQNAEALQPRNDSTRVLLLLVRAELEPRLEQRMAYLNQAKELDPESEVILYRFAVCSDLSARDREEITRENVDALSRKYEAVLKVNPGNIASFIGQGYLFWLVDDLNKAKKKLSAGIELQKIVSQTFIGDLKYGLARIEAERGAQQLSNGDSAEAGRLLNQAVSDYEEATLADPSVTASSHGGYSRVMNTYYARMTKQILERYERFACQMQKVVSVPGEPEAEKALTKARSFALNDYGNACFSYFLRFELGTETQHLERALCCLEKATAAPLARFNLFVAQTWKNDQREIYDSAYALLKEGAGLSPDQRATTLLFAIQERPPKPRNEPSDQPRQAATPPSPLAEEPVGGSAGKASDQQRAAPDGDRPAPGATAAGSKEFLSSTPIMEDLQPAPQPNLLTPVLEKPKGPAQWAPPTAKPSDAATRAESQPQESEPGETAQSLTPKEILNNGPHWVLQKTRLAPLERDLTPARVDRLLRDHTIDWSRFGDEEVAALVALAKVWSCGNTEETREACRRLCSHILRVYYPEHYDTLNTRKSVFTEGAKAEYRRDCKAIERVISWSQRSNPRSRRYRHLQLELCHEMALRLYGASPETFFKASDYKKVIKLYRSAEHSCKVFPEFHYDLGCAHENRERQLLESSKVPGGSIIKVRKAALKQRRYALKEFQEASGLDPGNRDYRSKLLSVQSRDWAARNKIEDSFIKTSFSYLVEVQIATTSVRELGFTEAQPGLPAGLQQKISAARDRLKREMGFILPGINFRDNSSLLKGQYLIIVRGVPVVAGVFNPANSGQNEKGIALIGQLEKISRKTAASFYTSQSLYNSLKQLTKIGSSDLSKTRNGNLSKIQNDPEALSALTAVLKSLLSEGVPIVNLAEIACEFCRCRSRKLSLVSAVEEIRALQVLRKQLPGNSLEVAAIGELSRSLEEQISQCVDWASPELTWTGSPGIRHEVRAAALNLSKEAGGKSVTLVSGQEVRPFVSKMVRDLDVHVLSRREILPGLVSRNRFENSGKR